MATFLSQKYREIGPNFNRLQIWYKYKYLKKIGKQHYLINTQHCAKFHTNLRLTVKEFKFFLMISNGMTEREENLANSIGLLNCIVATKTLLLYTVRRIYSMRCQSVNWNKKTCANANFPGITLIFKLYLLCFAFILISVLVLPLSVIMHTIFEQMFFNHPSFLHPSFLPKITP